MGRSADARLWFTRLRLENWRNFTHVEVPLQRRAFLVGPNASGKSNLLDVFRFLHDISEVGGGFAEAVRRRGGVSKIRALAARSKPTVTISVDLGNADDARLWTYELSFAQDNRQRPVVRTERVLRSGESVLERPDQEDNADPERLSQTHLEQVYANQQFREVAELFLSVQYLHLVPQLVRDPDRWAPRQDDPYGSDLLERIARKPEKTRERWLASIGQAVKIAVPQLDALELHRDPVSGTPHLRGKYVHWRLCGAWQTEEQFSDGTLRLIGLLWALLDGGGPLLLEEPELSLHPEVIRHIPQMFARVQQRRGRQVLVSTHSTEMLQDDGIGLDETLVLQPQAEGTSVSLARDVGQVSVLLNGGLTMGEAVFPFTRPPNASQLRLFEP